MKKTKGEFEDLIEKKAAENFPQKAQQLISDLLLFLKAYLKISQITPAYKAGGFTIICDLPIKKIAEKLMEFGVTEKQEISDGQVSEITLPVFKNGLISTVTIVQNPENNEGTVGFYASKTSVPI